MKDEKLKETDTLIQEPMLIASENNQVLKKKKFKFLNPIKWLRNRYSNEVKQWTNPYMMWLFISTDWIIIPTLFLTASSIFRMENLPEYKFQFLIGSFGFTASLAGLCSTEIKDAINVQLKRAKIKFIHSAIILFQCTALVFLVDQMKAIDFKPWFPSLLPLGIDLFEFLYSYLIAITGVLWFGAFARMNDVFWTYHYSWKYDVNTKGKGADEDLNGELVEQDENVNDESTKVVDK